MMLIPILTRVLDVEHWGWWLVWFYVLCGVIKGIWTATNKAIYADHFPDPHAESAFANMGLQSAVATLSVIVFEEQVYQSIGFAVIVILAALILPGYGCARGIREANKGKAYDSCSSDDDASSSNGLDANDSANQSDSDSSRS